MIMKNSKYKVIKNICKIFICPLSIIIFFLILTNCKKEKDTIIATNSTPKVFDVCGNFYEIVNIGSQVWMKENLRTTKLNDSTTIPLIENYNYVWDDITTPACCWYDNYSAKYKKTYGALYNWYTVKTGKLCPSGWHVPTEKEWSTLTNYLGGDNIAGSKLKEAGTSNWHEPNEAATNSSGFTAIPGGFRLSLQYYNMSYWGSWWTSTDGNVYYAMSRMMYYDSANVDIYFVRKTAGLSVRCIKD